MTFLPEIREFIQGMTIYDTHEHVAGFDWGYKPDDLPSAKRHPRKSLPHVLMNDMLLYITGSTGYAGPSLAPTSWKVEDAEGYWRAIQPVLEDLRGAAVYTTIREGLKQLYGFEGDDITDENWKALNEKIASTHEAKGEAVWMLETLERAKVRRIIQMAHLPYLIEFWPSLEPGLRARMQSIVKPSLVLEPFFYSGFEPDRSKARERTMELLGMHPKNHAEHLAFMHEAVRRHREAGGGSLKIIAAYQRTLFFDEVPDGEARRLYDKGREKLSAPEMQRLQDNLVWHLARFAEEFGFPIQVHTGYSLPVSLGNPENMYNLVRRFPKVPFYMCHAGWPGDGGLSFMARTFANVHFGFCWMIALSPALARRLMDEMFDLIPANKMLVGMDCGSPESFYGTNVMTRETTAQVLAGKVDAGLISRRAAKHLAQRFFHDNGLAMFGK